ncbi:hypothetical protein BRADI_5g07470v3 [Brachypodium distachyon]|uniref:Uncharacterized protein n=1 Tax=Brachypodium distachyon TaxID=15368 RepID=A0A2K2CFS7_BRADI|nr:hypothetical protein BRADI_5g07470v3 [Brachypodium distachyon]
MLLWQAPVNAESISESFGFGAANDFMESIFLFHPTNRAGYQFDHGFDWTLLKCKQIQKVKAQRVV